MHPSEKLGLLVLESCFSSKQRKKEIKPTQSITHNQWYGAFCVCSVYFNVFTIVAISCVPLDVVLSYSLCVFRSFSLFLSFSLHLLSLYILSFLFLFLFRPFSSLIIPPFALFFPSLFRRLCVFSGILLRIFYFRLDCSNLKNILLIQFSFIVIE